MDNSLFNSLFRHGGIFRIMDNDAFTTLNLKEQVGIIERYLIVKKIDECNGNKSKSARLLNISREALRKKIVLSDLILNKLEVAENLDKIKKENEHMEIKKMSTKRIENELNHSNIVTTYDVELIDDRNTFIVELNIIPPDDSVDMTILLNLKKKVRATVHLSYRIEFIIKFTV